MRLTVVHHNQTATASRGTLPLRAIVEEIRHRLGLECGKSITHTLNEALNVLGNPALAVECKQLALIPMAKKILSVIT